MVEFKRVIVSAFITLGIVIPSGVYDREGSFVHMVSLAFLYTGLKLLMSHIIKE